MATSLFYVLRRIVMVQRGFYKEFYGVGSHT